MVSTPTLASGAALLATLFTDKVQIQTVGEPVTTGFNVTRSLTDVGAPVAALVQQTTLDNAIESLTSAVYSVKVGWGTALHAGQAVRVVQCDREPSMVGRVLLVDKVTHNGMAMLVKATCTDYEAVNQQGKTVLS